MVLLGSLLACSNGSPWEEPTVAFDPSCADCTSVAVAPMDHVGDVELYVTEADDELAQWGGCVEAIMDCADAAADPAAALADCVADSPCAKACEGPFQSSGGDANAFQVTFLEPTGACGVPGSIEVTL